MSQFLNQANEIAENVRARGYMDTQRYGGVGVLVARNAFKLIEELGEYFDAVTHHSESLYGPHAPSLLQRWAEKSKALFDSGNTGYAVGDNKEHAEKELADAFVVLSVLAHLHNQLYGTQFDPMEAALAKSGADVQRGVRDNSHMIIDNVARGVDNQTNRYAQLILSDGARFNSVDEFLAWVESRPIKDGESI